MHWFRFAPFRILVIGVLWLLLSPTLANAGVVTRDLCNGLTGVVAFDPSKNAAFCQWVDTQYECTFRVKEGADDVVHTADCLLTIASGRMIFEAGAELRFGNGGGAIITGGDLVFAGTSTSPVRFTAMVNPDAPVPLAWTGLYISVSAAEPGNPASLQPRFFTGSGTPNVIANVVVLGAKSGLRLENLKGPDPVSCAPQSGVTCEFAPINLRSLKVANSGDGLQIEGGNVLGNGLTIDQISGGGTKRALSLRTSFAKEIPTAVWKNVTIRNLSSSGNSYAVEVAAGTLLLQTATIEYATEHPTSAIYVAKDASIEIVGLELKTTFGPPSAEVTGLGVLGTANATNVTMSGGWQKAFVVNSDGMLNIVSSQLVAAFAECFACKLVLGTSTFSGRLDVSGTTAEVSIDSTRFSGSATLLQQTPADSGFLEIVNSTFFEGKVILWGNATLRFNTVHGMTTGGIAFNSDYGPTTTPVELVGNLVVAPKTGIRYRSHWKLTANNVDAIEKGAEYLSQSGETTVPSGNTTLHAVLRYSASDPYPRLQPGSDPALFDALDPSQVPEISVDYWGRSRVDKLDIGAIEAPTILSVTPNAGRRGDSLTLALNGVNLVGPISVALLSVEPQSCNTCVVSSACREGFLNDFCWSCLLDSCGVPGIVLDGQALTPESTTSLRSSLALGLSDSVALGTYHLLLGEPDVEDGITVIPSFFTVHDKLAATTIEPTTGAQGTKLTLTVTGTGLDLGTPSVSFGDPKLAVSNVQVAPGGTSLTFDLDVDPAAALGGYTLTVTGGDGKTTTLPSALTVTPVVVEPDTVEPDSGSDPDLAVAPDADPDLAVAPDADPDLAVAPDADPDLAVAPDADPDVSVAPDTTATPDVARSDISSDIPDGASANGDVVGELDANPGSSDTADATPTPDLSTGGNTSSKSSSGGCSALDATPSSQPLVLLLIFVIGSLLLRRVARRVMAQ